MNPSAAAAGARATDGATPSAPLGWGARAALAVGLAYLGAYIAIALLRMRFPFELEWMEGANLGHVDRVLRGLPLYVRPGIEFTPFIYPPFYFVVAAWVAKLIGPGFLPLRLVSFLASLGCFGLIYAYVRPASSS